jgi:DNA-binding NarL/FixJ family response regulator
MNPKHGWLALIAVEEDSFVRKAARALSVSISVVRTRQEFLRRVDEYRTVLIGDHQSRGEQISLIRQIRDADDERVIATVAIDPSMKIDLLEAGADAIVSLYDRPERLADRIRAALEGQVILDPDETAALVRRFRRLSRLCVNQGIDVDRCKQLTQRERDIVALLARRATNVQIADELGVAVGTVKNHVHNILAKLDVDSRRLAGVYWRVFSERTGLER